MVAYLGASTSIVAYDCSPGFGGLFSAPRVWWLFRLFGHERVGVLDGGFDIWKTQYPVGSKTHDSHPPPNPKRDVFRAKLRPNLLRTYEQILDSIEESESALPLIDARSRGDYANARIPKAKNLLFKRLVDPETGMLKTLPELDELFDENAGVDLTSPGRKFVCSCVTGTTACSLSFAAHVVGEERGIDIETALYDGSMQEWMALEGPIETAN